MTRLQKKCLIAVAGTHLLVVVTLLCSGFITSKPTPDDTQVLDVIPANLIDAALSSGIKGAVAPPPTPIVRQVEPTPEPPKPVVKQVEPVKPPDKIQPEDLKPADKPDVEKPKPKEHVVKPDLTIIKRDKPKVDNSAAEAEKAKEQKRIRDQQKNVQKLVQNLKNNLTTGTTVDMPGTSTVAYANYASVVKSVYTQAWTPPDDTASDDANVKVSVTIANDGRVISAHIIGPSGDSSVDKSVQRTLDRVFEIAPFPDGATDKERNYIINFNLKAKRMLG